MLIELQRVASLASGTYRDVLLAHPEAIDLPLAQIEERRVHVAERNGTVLGFCVVLPPEAGAAELDGWFVDPALWRQGLGRRLVREAERLAVAGGADVLSVTANPDALEFYESCAFQTIGEVATRFDVAKRMEKRLTP